MLLNFSDKGGALKQGGGISNQVEPNQFSLQIWPLFWKLHLK